MLCIVVSGLLVGGAAATVGAEHSEGDEEHNEDEDPTDTDVNDYSTGSEDSDETTIEVGIIG